MSKITTLPTTFKEGQTVAEYFRKLADDATKFPENYVSVALLNAPDNMLDISCRCLTAMKASELISLLELAKHAVFEHYISSDE